LKTIPEAGQQSAGVPKSLIGATHDIQGNSGFYHRCLRHFVQPSQSVILKKQKLGTSWRLRLELASPNSVFKKRLQFNKEISDVLSPFARQPHDHENLVIEVKCGDAPARCLISHRACSTTDCGANFWLKIGNKRRVRSYQPR
jgi:hypothetical protein